MLIKKDTHKTTLLKMQSKLKMQLNYSIYQKFNEKIAEFQKTIW